MTRCLPVAIQLCGRRSGQRRYDHYMGGAMVSVGDNLDTIAETLATVYDTDAGAILRELKKVEQAEYDRLRTKGVSHVG